jgi:hypothetical protein
MSALATVEPPAREQEMLKLYEQGLTYTKIGERFNYHQVSILRLIKPYLTVDAIVLHEYNYSRKLLGRTKPISETLSMRRLYLAGFTYAEIGTHYGIGEIAVSERIKSLLTNQQRILARKHQLQRRADRREAIAASYRPRTRELVKAGWSNTAIKKELELGSLMFRLVMAGISAALRMQRYSRVRQIQKIQYNNDAKLAVLREAATLNGGRLSQASYGELRRSHPHWPSLTAYLRVKPWNSWLTEAGIPVTKPRGKGRKRTFGDQQCNYAVERVAFKLERVFTAPEYEAHRLPTDPTAVMLARWYGKGRWVVALEYLAPLLFGQRPA